MKKLLTLVFVGTLALLMPTEAFSQATSVAASPDTAMVCEGSSEAFTFTPQGSCAGNYEYQIMDGGTVVQAWSTSNTFNASPIANTTYTVQLRCSSSPGTVVTDNFYVLVVPEPTVTGNLNLCAGQSTTLNASGTGTEWWDAATGGNQLSANGTYNSGPLTNTTTVYTQAAGQNNSTGVILITECGLEGFQGNTSADYLEVSNLYTTPVNTTGWVAAVSNSYSNINSVNSILWNFPPTFNPCSVVSRNDISGDPNYWGNNILWNPGANATYRSWAIILDNNGNIVDFVAWGWTAVDLAGFNTTINGFNVTLGPEWIGNGCDATCGTTGAVPYSIQRVGNSDNNNSGDFVCQASTPNVVNPGLVCGWTPVVCRWPVTITVNPLPTVTAAAVDALCNGACDGQVTATGATGTGPYTYNWTGGLPQGSPNTAVCAGTYDVTVTDANGCIGTTPATVTVNEPPALTATDASTGETCAGDADGTITLTGGGGTPTYTYDIGSGPQATGSFTGLAPGNYNYTVTDANGCTVTGTVTVAIGPTCCPMTNTVASSNPTCAGACDGTITLTENLGAPTVTFSIDGGTTSQTNGNFTGVCAGTHNILITDGYGCQYIDQVTLTDPPALGGSISSQTDVSCNGVCDGSVTVAGSGGTGALTYDIGAGPQASGTFTGLCAGANDVTVTDANGCTFVIPVTITQPAVLGGSITAQTDVSCFGLCDGSVTVAGSGGTAPYQYDNGGALQASGTFTGLCVGANDITVTDANGCTFVVAVTITEPTAVAGTLNSTTDATCGQANGAADVSASGGTGPYQYDIGTGNQATGVFTGLTPGAYTVTVTDANGCQTTVAVTINDLSGLTASITTQTDVSCFGVCDGSVDITAGGSTAPYSYDIGNGPQGTGTFTGLCAGTYTVTVTDANGCTFPVAVTITEPTALSGSINTQTDASCNGVCDGTVDVTATGGTGPYQYDAGAGQQASGVFTGLCAGANDVTVTDANGCTFVISVTINEPTALGGSITTQVDVSCNGVCDGSVDVAATGGTAPYQYDIGAGQQATGVFTGLCVGANDVTVTDANGCTFVIAVTITEPTPVAGTLNGTTDATCGAANGAADVSASGGTGPYQYDIGNGNQATGVFTGLMPGAYTVTITDANGCQTTVAVNIADLSGLTASITAQTDVSCNGACDGSVTVTASGSTGPYDYDIGNGPVANGTFSNLCAGPYTVIVTDVNGCPYTVNVTITEPTAMTVAGTVVNDLCNQACNGSIDITAGGGVTPYTFAWTGPGGPYNTEDLTNLCAGTYDLTLTDANGCVIIEQYVVTEPTAITLNTTSNSSNCGQSDGSVGVTAMGGTVAVDYTYDWQDANGTSVASTSIANNLPAGTYTIIVTDDNGCTVSVTETISDIGGGTAAAAVTSNYNGQDISCAGNCDGEVTITMTGGTAPFSYDLGGTIQATNIYTGLCAGTHSIMVTDNLGCSAAASVTITEPTPVTATAVIVDETCFGDCTGMITITAGGGILPYEYTFDNGTTYGPTNNLSGLCSGTYNIGARDANGCKFDLTVTVADGAPIADATIAPVNDFCADDAAVILTAAQTGGTWSGNGITDPATGAFDPSVAGAGIHQIFYDIPGACGDQDDVMITVFALPTVSFIADDAEGCAPLTVTLSNSTPGSSACAWDFGIGTDNTCGPHTLTYDTPGSYDVTLTVTSNDGCVNTLTQPGLINVYENPVADFEFGPQPTTTLDPTINFTNTSHLGDAFQWYFEDLDSSNLENPVYTFEEPGIYNTQLIVTTNEGCTDQIEYLVEILEATVVYVPNSFTPDGDGLNDFFFPVVSGISDQDYEFFVFNRWGELIFESYHPGQQWDGTVKGMDAKQDVYVWKVVVSGLDGEHKEYIGHVTLLR